MESTFWEGVRLACVLPLEDLSAGFRVLSGVFHSKKGREYLIYNEGMQFMEGNRSASSWFFAGLYYLTFGFVITLFLSILIVLLCFYWQIKKLLFGESF